MGNELHGSPAHWVVSPGAGTGTVDVKPGLSGGQASALPGFLLNALASHVLSLCCFGLISVCCVLFGETVLGLGAQEGARRKWGDGRGTGIGGEFCVLNCEMNTC